MVKQKTLIYSFLRRDRWKKIMENGKPKINEKSEIKGKVSERNIPHFVNGELHIFWKLMNLKIGEHSSFFFNYWRKYFLRRPRKFVLLIDMNLGGLKMVFLYGDLHIIWKPRNIKICEHSIFVQLLNNNM